MPSKIKDFMDRLFAISKGMSGEEGKRIRALVQVIMKAGYPRCLDLWYYNYYAIRSYVDVDLSLHTGNAKRREMTKATNGALPFDGDSGVHTQRGTFEQSSGKWRIHIVKELFDQFACDRWDVSAMERFLNVIDDDMWRGWDQLRQVSGRFQSDAGSVWGPEVSEFVNHVQRLTQDDTHLYSAFAP
jgi:hypothetical protein